MNQFILDLLQDDSFSQATLGEAVQRGGKVWGKIKQMGVFRFIGISTSTVAIDVEKDNIIILPQTQRGGSATYEKKLSRNAIYFGIPNFKRKEVLTPQDLQNVRDTGTASLKSLQSAVMQAVGKIDRKIEVTHEYLMAGALRGNVMDGEGNVIANLFQKFGKTQSTVNLTLAATDKAILGQLSGAEDIIDTNLDNDVSTGKLMLCSPEYWAALLSNSAIFEIYKNRDKAGNPYLNGISDGFQLGGFYCVKYSGTLKNKAGSVQRLIPANEAIGLPIGTESTFVMYGAPADLLEYVNQEGQEKYFKTVYDSKDGEDNVIVRGETNPLPICTRPDVLIRFTKS